jgi:short-subunit dehydrogenase
MRIPFVSRPVERIALITGASSGIGAAAARRLAAGGFRVLLVARRLGRLKDLQKDILQAGGCADHMLADLGRQRDRQRLFRFVMKRYGRLDLLINNAGLGWYGYAAQMPWQTAEEMLQVNVAATLQLTLLFLPEMQKHGSGQIINIGSIAGKMPNQGVAMYSATKSFLDAFTTAVFRELQGGRVHVSVLRPGPVTTEFFDRAQRRSNGLRTPGEGFATTPEKVADAIWRLVRHPRKVAYVPGIFSLSPWLEILFGWLIDRIGPVLLKRSQKKAAVP